MPNPHKLLWCVVRKQPGGWDYVIQLWQDGHTGDYWLSYPDATVRLTGPERADLIAALSDGGET